MAWHVYVAQCKDGSLYTGIALNLQQRFREHNAGRGSVYVRSRGGATLKYTETRRTRPAAQRRECEIKSWPRQKKLALIQGTHNA